MKLNDWTRVLKPVVNERLFYSLWQLQNKLLCTCIVPLLQRRKKKKKDFFVFNGTPLHKASNKHCKKEKKVIICTPTYFNSLSNWNSVVIWKNSKFISNIKDSFYYTLKLLVLLLLVLILLKFLSLIDLLA